MVPDARTSETDGFYGPITYCQLAPGHGGPELFGRKPCLPNDAFYVQIPHLAMVAIDGYYALDTTPHADPFFMRGAHHWLLLEAERTEDGPHRFARQRLERHGGVLDRRDQWEDFLELSDGGYVAKLHATPDEGVPDIEIQGCSTRHKIANVFSVSSKCISEIRRNHAMKLLAALLIRVAPRVQIQWKANREPSAVLVALCVAPKNEIAEFQVSVRIPSVHPLALPRSQRNRCNSYVYPYMQCGHTG